MKTEMKQKIEDAIKTAVELVFDAIDKENPTSGSMDEDEVKDWATEAANEAVDFDEDDIRGWAADEAETYVDGLDLITEDDVYDKAREVAEEAQEDTLDADTIERLIDERCFNDSITCAKSYERQWDAFIGRTKDEHLTEVKTKYRLEKIQPELSHSLANLPPLPRLPKEDETVSA